MTHDEDRAACAASVDPELIEATFAELAADLAPVYHDRPCRLHHLLDRACWDEDAARDAVRAFLTGHPGAGGGVLIFDETGQAKKGTATAAAGRRYSGTMGRAENVIVAVYTTYAANRGHALTGRDLYVLVSAP